MGYYIPLSHMVLDAALNGGTSDNVYSLNRSSRFNLFIALKKIHTQIYPLVLLISLSLLQELLPVGLPHDVRSGFRPPVANPPMSWTLSSGT